jgi:hypothetical protein
MIWNLVAKGSTELSAVVPDDFIVWLLPQLVDERVRGIDPYCDTAFDTPLIRAWLSELQRVASEVRSETREACARRGRWPKDPLVRDRLLTEAAERALATDSNFRVLQDAMALLELAREKDGTIDVWGD